MNIHIEILIILALAIASISMTITRSSIFTKLRKLLKSVPFLGKLIKCPYCFAHWVSFLAIFLTHDLNLVTLIIGSFALVTLSVVPMILIEYFYNLLEKTSFTLGNNDATFPQNHTFLNSKDR